MQLQARPGQGGGLWKQPGLPTQVLWEDFPTWALSEGGGAGGGFRWRIYEAHIVVATLLRLSGCRAGRLGVEGNANLFYGTNTSDFIVY